MKVANKLEKASKAHAGQAKTLRVNQTFKGGGAAIRGIFFKVFLMGINKKLLRSRIFSRFKIKLKLCIRKNF